MQNRGALTALTFDLRVISRQGSNGPLQNSFTGLTEWRLQQVDLWSPIHSNHALCFWIATGASAMLLLWEASSRPVLQQHSAIDAIPLRPCRSNFDGGALKDVYGLDADLAIRWDTRWFVCFVGGKPTPTSCCLIVPEKTFRLSDLQSEATLGWKNLMAT